MIACSGILTFILKCTRSGLLDQRPIKQEYFLLKEVLLIWMKLCSWNIRYLNLALKKFETEQHLDWTWITCQKKGAKNGYSSKPYIGWIFWFVTFCYSAPCISWILGFVTFKCDLHWSVKEEKMTLNKGLKNQMSWFEAEGEKNTKPSLFFPLNCQTTLLNIFLTRESDFMIFLHGNIRTGQSNMNKT